ncbi:hypothetical protein B0H14DRAFT_2576401 [Mycena olivaceomarginata]|nr:hypothetical protein B0H14DRAFT_2576401 [Mycena olivaceomarginata]
MWGGAPRYGIVGPYDCEGAGRWGAWYCALSVCEHWGCGELLIARGYIVWGTGGIQGGSGASMGGMAAVSAWMWAYSSAPEWSGTSHCAQSRPARACSTISTAVKNFSQLLRPDAGSTDRISSSKVARTSFFSSIKGSLRVSISGCMSAAQRTWAYISSPGGPTILPRSSALRIVLLILVFNSSGDSSQGPTIKINIKIYPYCILLFGF